MSNSTVKEEPHISMMDAGLFLIALSLAVFISSANATTIVAIYRTPALRTLANTYVCSLACADFIVGLACILMALYMLPPVRMELFDKHLGVCLLFQGIVIGMALLSAIHMTLIATDRYLYIIRPYVYQRVINFRVISAAVGATWVVGLTLSFLPQFTANPYDEVPACDVTERQPVWYTFYVCLVLYSSLCVVNFILYSIILHAAGKQRKAVRANVPLANQNATDKDAETSTNINKGTMKSIKFFLTVFGVFLVCGTPTVVCIGMDYYADVPEQVYRFMNLITMANSGMNFIIYAAMNKQFRQAFIRNSILAKCTCLKSFRDASGEKESQ